MASPPVRFSQLRWLQNVACVLALIGSLGLIGLGAVGYGESPHLWMMAAGGLWLFLAVMYMSVTPLLLKMESTVTRQLGEMRDLRDVMANYGDRLDAIADNTRLSDAAKSLAHREQDIAAFRDAIRDDIRLGKWEAALRLADDVEQRFGYKEEADAVREEIDEARDVAIQDTLSAAIELIERHFGSHEWSRAETEIDRLRLALPDETRVVSLVERMKALKERHKGELMRSWDEAVRRSDIDQAIDILKELDQYLSPAEAEALQASARDVFKLKLLQLGVQFRFAVTEKRWQDALTCGLELVREYPNARMAGEVREVLDTLRERARGHGEAPANTATTPGQS